MSENTACLLILDMSNQHVEATGYNRTAVKGNIAKLARNSTLFGLCVSTRPFVPKFRAHLKATDLIGELEGLGNIIHLPRKTDSAMAGTTLAELLTSNNVTHVCVCGTSTDTSIHATVRDLIENGFTVYVASDASTSKNGKKGHEQSIMQMKNEFGNEISVQTDVLMRKLTTGSFASAPQPPFNPHLAVLPAKNESTFQKPNCDNTAVRPVEPAKHYPSSPVQFVLEQNSPPSSAIQTSPVNHSPKPITPERLSVAAQRAAIIQKLQLGSTTKAAPPKATVNPVDSSRRNGYRSPTASAFSISGNHAESPPEDETTPFFVPKQANDKPISSVTPASMTQSPPKRTSHTLMEQLSSLINPPDIVDEGIPSHVSAPRWTTKPEPEVSIPKIISPEPASPKEQPERRKFKTAKVFTSKRDTWDRGNIIRHITKYITEPDGRRRIEKDIEYISKAPKRRR